MCLIIDTVPKTVRDSNCVECFKLHDPQLLSSGRMTPFRRYPIPDDGVLHVRVVTSERRRLREIHGYGIHAYCSGGQVRTSSRLSRAFAFGIIAYGDVYGNGDLVCTLLYIPALDKSGLKRKRMRQINEWLYGRQLRPTNKEVKQLFPDFVPPVP